MSNIQCSISNVQYSMFKWGGPDSPTAQGRGGLMAWRRGNRGPANDKRRGGQYPISNVQVGGQRPPEGADLIHPRHKAVGV